jgi:AraC-like DNA-binding protein
MSTRAVDLSIAQAATDRGFHHLSHFTERCKALFGELPSQTMRADCDRSAAARSARRHGGNERSQKLK